jgi:hypothetical protein
MHCRSRCCCCCSCVHNCVHPVSIVSIVISIHLIIHILMANFTTIRYIVYNQRSDCVNILYYPLLRYLRSVLLCDRSREIVGDSTTVRGISACWCCQLHGLLCARKDYHTNTTNGFRTQGTTRQELHII